MVRLLRIGGLCRAQDRHAISAMREFLTLLWGPAPRLEKCQRLRLLFARIQGMKLLAYTLMYLHALKFSCFNICFKALLGDNVDDL